MSDTVTQVGGAKHDITPDYPIRLNGYAVRSDESVGVRERIWTRALAIGSDEAGPALLVSVENVGLPREVTERVAREVETFGVTRERFVAAYTHTHYAPCLKGSAPFIFGEDIAEDQRQVIDRYTDQLVEAMVVVCREALARREPARLERAEGSVGFAGNRRTPGGPVDHALPAMRAVRADGTLLAIWTTYACHCTTFHSALNQLCGDWAGYAQDAIEASHRGATAIVTIGCGADSNPDPRGESYLSKNYGESLAREVERLLRNDWTPVRGNVTGRIQQADLPFDRLPTRAEWVALTTEKGVAGYHARKFVDRLDRAETIPAALAYPVQSWEFGSDAAVLFLPGEVVVDYSLLFRRLYKHLWVVAYANEFPCYIPSERILQEGGYEGGDAMVYFGQPTRFASGVEARIVEAARHVIPQVFEM